MPDAMTTESGAKYVRHESYSFNKHFYMIDTTCCRNAKKLDITLEDGEVIYSVSGSQITKLHYKLKDDIFTLHGDASHKMPQKDDEALWKGIRPLASCLVACVLDEPWSFTGVYSEIVDVPDVGDGDYIKVKREQLSAGSVFPYYPGYPPPPKARVIDPSTFNQQIQQNFLSDVGVVTAQQVFKKESMEFYHEVASSVGYFENRGIGRRTFGTFRTTVPTKFGQMVSKLSLWRGILQRGFDPPISSPGATSTNSTRTQSKSGWDAREDEVDLETGLIESVEDEHDGSAAAEETAHDGDSTSRADSENLNAAGALPSRDLKAFEERKADTASVPEEETPSKPSEPSPTTAPESKGKTDDNWKSMEQGDSGGDAGRDDEGSASPIGESNKPREFMQFGRRHNRQRFLTASGQRPVLSNYYYTGFERISMAKGLVVCVVYAAILTLAILTIALDPAQEGNWFRRIEDGVFVAISFGIPAMFALRSRACRQLDKFLPPTEREIRSVNDLRVGNKHLDDVSYIKALQKELLVNSALSEKFSFKNASYKKSRKEGKIDMPELATYDDDFKQVWCFGNVIAYNKLTAQAHKYCVEDDVIVIEREETKADGAIVHVARRDGVYRIGKDGGNEHKVS